MAFALLALALAGAAAFAYLQAGEVASSAGRPWIYASIAAGLLALLALVSRHPHLLRPSDLSIQRFRWR